MESELTNQPKEVCAIEVESFNKALKIKQNLSFFVNDDGYGIFSGTGDSYGKLIVPKHTADEFCKVFNDLATCLSSNQWSCSSNPEIINYFKVGSMVYRFYISRLESFKTAEASITKAVEDFCRIASAIMGDKNGVDVNEPLEKIRLNYLWSFQQIRSDYKNYDWDFLTIEDRVRFAMDEFAKSEGFEWPLGLREKIAAVMNTYSSKTIAAMGKNKSKYRSLMTKQIKEVGELTKKEFWNNQAIVNLFYIASAVNGDIKKNSALEAMDRPVEAVMYYDYKLALPYGKNIRVYPTPLQKYLAAQKAIKNHYQVYSSACLYEDLLDFFEREYPEPMKRFAPGSVA
jgi:hypothetical protein